MTVKSRIAPTPSGFLHKGNLFSFVLTNLLTKKNGGKLLLRIDDLDAPRIRSAYIDNIFYWLKELQITPDEGPADHSALKQQWSQRLRMDKYYEVIDKLIKTGRTYNCYCSRAALLQRPCHCKHKKQPNQNGAASLKLSLPAEAVVWQDEKLGLQTVELKEKDAEVIIRTKQDTPAYHIASLCDDIAFGVNYIIRGEDLVQSTAIQLSIARLLGLNAFPESIFHHHPIISDGDRKLSKSAGDGIITVYAPETTAAINLQIERCLYSFEQYRPLLK